MINARAGSPCPRVPGAIASSDVSPGNTRNLPAADVRSPPGENVGAPGGGPELPDVAALLAIAVAGIGGAERPGQVAMARAVQHSIETGEHLALPKGTGLTVDIGGGLADGPVVALRADLDALPISDEKNVPYRSVIAGACHACGHDVHTTIPLGAGLFLARAAAAGPLRGRVRLIFQPAEEVPGGAIDVLSAGGIASVNRIFALHCDPRLDLGKIGTRTGPITAACDKITVRVTGPGGHTARPHLTADLVYALGKIITELPAALGRRVDPRSSLSLVWGRVSAGSAANAIPDDGEVEGTVRCLDDNAWHAAPDLLKALRSE